MEHVAGFLLVVQMALAGIALFVLVDGLEWVRDHIRVVTLSAVLIGGIVWITLTSRWAMTSWGYGAFGMIGVAGAGCLCASFISAREVWRRSFSRKVQGREQDDAQEQWLVFDGRRELGPFSTVELIERFSSGEIAPSDHVWKPGMDRWRPAYAAGLQGIAVRRVAIPLSDASNHPQGLESGCPSSIGVVPPWMARSWTHHHPERTRSVGT